MKITSLPKHFKSYYFIHLPGKPQITFAILVSLLIHAEQTKGLFQAFSGWRKGLLLATFWHVACRTHPFHFYQPSFTGFVTWSRTHVGNMH